MFKIPCGNILLLPIIWFGLACEYMDISLEIISAVDYCLPHLKTCQSDIICSLEISLVWVLVSLIAILLVSKMFI